MVVDWHLDYNRRRADNDMLLGYLTVKGETKEPLSTSTSSLK